jgi:hypothetical protein
MNREIHREIRIGEYPSCHIDLSLSFCSTVYSFRFPIYDFNFYHFGWSRLIRILEHGRYYQSSEGIGAPGAFYPSAFAQTGEDDDHGEDCPKCGAKRVFEDYLEYVEVRVHQSNVVQFVSNVDQFFCSLINT